MLLLLVLGISTVGAVFVGVSRLLPVKDISDYEPTEVTKIYSSDGVLLADLYEEQREVVPITQIPEDLRNATIAIEDKRFYEHFGVDVIGVFRAVYQNLRRGGMAQGGSTLTQQLARNIYLTREKKLSRKLQEMVLAVELERNYSKEQILELYLNQVFYGSGAWGVQTAAKVYFGKDVKDLSLAECALIAGLPQRPSGYSPYKDPEAAVGRRNVVLDRMYEQGYITEEARDKAKDAKLRLVGLKPGGLSQYKAPWFVTYVTDQLIDEYGADVLYKSGLRVYTTLNYEMQQVAERELRKHIEDAKSRRVSQGALVCIDPHTGYIKAMVGGVNPDFTKDQYNRAVKAHRQPGSAFKAFVYTAAVENGYDTNYRISNQRITFGGYGGESWSPRNYDGRYGGYVTMKRAVAQSINIPAVRMAEKVGIDQVISYAHMLGIKSPLTRNLSLALGASGVTPLELCSAYGVFAADGIRAEPMSIVRITGASGDHVEGVLEEKRPDTKRVLSEQTAKIMQELFRAVVTQGTGRTAGSIPRAHGKTGTTSDNRDAWFIGFTPELVTAIWVGNDDYRKTMYHVYGGNVCAPTWTAFMKEALRIHKAEQTAEEEPSRVPSETEPRRRREEVRPEREIREETEPQKIRVSICKDSSLLARPECPSTYEAEFEPGTAPTARCDIHGGRSPERPEVQTTAPKPPTRPGADENGYVTVNVCVDSGLLATRYCPEQLQKRFRAGEAPTKSCRRHKAPTE
ncbi:MAG: transglycosylase domain-containing protein [Armatimonadota bacterium]